jgi:hypothetical protein
MHAILGMAASDLMKSDASLVTFAMTHRVKAIRGIKKLLNDMPRTSSSYEEANALIAACFALTFQSVALDDGIAEYMTFIRGIMIVGMHMWIKGIKPIFSNMIGQDSANTLAPHMEILPLLPREWADGAITAIESLRALCQAPVEIEYGDIILEMARNLRESSFEGIPLPDFAYLLPNESDANTCGLTAYKGLQKQYGWFIMLPHEKFQQLIDADNQIILLLHTHWVALQQVMAFITQAEFSVRQKAPETPPDMDIGILRWLKHLNPRISHEYIIYNQWPIWVEYQLDQDITFFGKRY